MIVAWILICLLFASIAGIFLFAEYRSFKRGRECYFWHGAVGQWVVRNFHLSGKSRFSTNIYN
jgi:hypothetical protein